MMERALRFAMVTTFYPPYHFGGDGEAVRGLAQTLARRGHQVDVIHDLDAYRALGGKADSSSETETEGVKVHSLRSKLGALSTLATQQLGRPVVHGRRIRKILSQDFDVIHFHNISLVGGPTILSYGNAVKLYTAHEHWLVCPSHVLWRHNREICDRRECLRCVLRYKRPPQAWRYGSLLQRETQHVDRFLTLSRFCAEKHRELGFDRPFTVIPTFLPDSVENEEGAEDDANSKAGAAERPFVLFAGRLEIIKGLDDVIPLFGDDAPADLWIAGTGNHEHRLRELAKDRPRVRFLGWLPPSTLRRLYREALAVVMPSICYEVFPMVILEALREGVPILARRLGPLPEIIEDSQAGMLFETPQELKQALDQLTGRPGLRDTLGQAGREALQNRWSEAVFMKQYLDLIKSVAQERRLTRVEQKFSGIGAEPEH